MKIEIKEIDLREKIADFSQYLATTDRIILSAKFGDGKTYFLNQLRQNEDLNKDFKFFTIYPVNYSVAKNEDVFEYIKRDIIFQLNKEGLLDKIDIDAVFDSLVSFDDVRAVVSFLLSFVAGGAFYDKIFNKFWEKKKEYEEKKHTADKYLSSFTQKQGGIYEEDGYTLLIRNAIKWMKEDHAMNGPEWKGKKAVLIVEDLDRLDPKHLFRILNVLSAHIDDTTNPDLVTNKFGFRNIVLVMDYEATEHIFHHFYGENACYDGYMSKFLSREPFRYSIQHFIALEIENELSGKLGIANIVSAFGNFRKRLHQLSIRDLKKLTMFDTQERIKKDYFEYRNMKFSTSLPIFHLIIYMIECGLSVDEIVADMTSQITNISRGEMIIKLPEYLKIRYLFYAIKEKKRIAYFMHGVGKFVVSERKEEDIITEIDISPAMQWESNTIVNVVGMNIEETVRWCLDVFTTCINTAALWSKQET
jgi:hypothetical protein